VFPLDSIADVVAPRSEDPMLINDNLYSPSNGSRKKNNNNNNDKNNIEIKNNKYKHAQNCATTRKLHLLLA